jgi:transcriptional regulator with XRE-family HTH domain
LQLGCKSDFGLQVCRLKHGTAPVSNRVTALQDRIKAIRLTGKALSQATGLDEDTISRTFTGKTRPLNDTLEKIEAVVLQEERRIAERLAHVLPGDAA